MSFDSTSAYAGTLDNTFRTSDILTLGGLNTTTSTGLNGSTTNPSNYTLTNYTGAPATIAAGNKVILTDVFVLQISYNQAAAAAAGSTAEFIGWNFGGGFVNATFGNSGTGSAGGAPTLFGGAANGEYMNESYADYLAGLSPTDQTTLANQLGAYGFYDGVAWAVLDHTGFSDATNTLVAGTNEFAVIPEPSTWGMVVSGFGLLIGIQKLRKRRMGI
jgi:hypothetical protein